eukprot:CAMPEP_0170480198 /NCGR_PEP_ID=MMETSP0208-20121228/1132_1 /TAXON_ID=197538 /ORGANISM="Strombidium inclinatum, Strain S3" /LENGTH=70 /DNA_ID=CAMNT_0010752707 /DNA_START=45 /DNA_END=257 /DNA_ORIENTATION=+
MIPLVQESYEGFLQPLIFNFILFYFSAGKLMACNAIGMWGLFWFNDDGEMQQKCFETGLQGGTAEFFTSN